MTFPALNHVAVTVRDLEVSGAWYGPLIGAEPVLDEHTSAGYQHLVWAFENGTLFGIHQHDRKCPPNDSPNSGPGWTTSASDARIAPNWKSGFNASTPWASPTAGSSTRATGRAEFP